MQPSTTIEMMKQINKPPFVLKGVLFRSLVWCFENFLHSVTFALRSNDAGQSSDSKSKFCELEEFKPDLCLLKHFGFFLMS